MAKQQIGLLFGVQGGGKLSGESGQLILQQLNKIARSIDNTNNRMKVTIGVNEAQTRQLIQKQLNNISRGLTINVNPAVNNSANNIARQTQSYERRLQSLHNRLWTGWFGGDADRKKLSHLNSGQWDEYIRSYHEAHAAMSVFIDDQGRFNAALGNDTQMQRAIETAEQFLNVDARIAASREREQSTLDKTRFAYDKTIDSITKYQQRNARTLQQTPMLRDELESFRQALVDGTITDLPGAVHDRFLNLTNQIRQAGGETESLGTKIKRMFSEKAGYGAVGAVLALGRRALREVYNNVVELDKAVVDLQIATGKNRQEVKELVNTYSDLGRELGATTSEVAKSADTWLRQGYNIEDTNELIKQSTMLSKLGQMESAEASTALTSSLKGYQLAASDAASVVDKLTAVDMEAAASAGDIATAMAECANSARIAGVDMNTLIGYLTTVKEVTQDGSESVGTFAKTMFARMGNIKAGNLEDPETGENLSDVEASLSSVGIKLRSANDHFRDFDDVLTEVAADWDNYSNVQQHAIAVAFAGTRQQEKFLVLMENYGDAMEYAGVSTESAGTALDKYTNSYLPSVQAAQDSFTASFEQFSQTLLNSDTVAGVIRFGDGLMQMFTWLSKIKALLPAIVAGFMSWKNVGKLNSPNMPAYAQLQLVA